MSAASLPRTGTQAAITIGGIGGLGQLSLPLPAALVTAAAMMIVIGALLVRLSFRPGRPASDR
ncbi:hypothetical protein [Micromonospora sp. NBC_01813]|uniref:hypothetical protein n=1 Tax=Micromonospora sp. NBC_01813 TaxID=2975988 RepID=UPI002DD7F475|nr:hypothetical protein [Micromonospora sp. NBC_01813]WSA07877.1 hypothetical protein OG958_27220 [Micromonospora sp. NBC_01813]